VNELLDKIHSRAYWRVLMRPTQFDSHRIPSLSRCKEIIEKSYVLLRGWDYPHFEEKDVHPGDESIELGCDWEDRHLEYWRFYQSGQFVHHFTCWEEFHRLNRSPAPERYLSVLSALYTATEIFEFAARVARHEVLRPEAEISIQLHGMKERELTFEDLWRSMSVRGHVSGRDQITCEVTVPQVQLLAGAPELALDTAIAIFERFGWFNPPRQTLADDQRKLLERRLGV